MAMMLFMGIMIQTTPSTAVKVTINFMGKVAIISYMVVKGMINSMEITVAIS